MSIVSKLKGLGSFARGVHPPQGKHFAADAPIEVLPTPPQVTLALLQHTGAACQAAVKPKDAVTLGQVVGTAGGFVSAPVHASIAGIVQLPVSCTLANGRHVKAVAIKAEGQQLEGRALYDDVLGGQWPTAGLDRFDPAQIAAAVKEAGIVGLGGAAFPTHVKLTPNAAKPIDTLLVNGCECEPYLTADYRLMLESPASIVAGTILAARAAGAANAIIAVENNKMPAAEALANAAHGTMVKVQAVDTKYPMGGERQLTVAVLGREVPTGGLPLDVGVAVINVGTASAIARAVLRGKPLTHRVVTVGGSGVRQSKNLLVPVGVSHGRLIEHCGGLTDDAERVIAGGPMMGFALGELDTPVTKGTSGITVLSRPDVKELQETACLRCGRCVDVCPLHLVPSKIAMASRNKDWALAKRYCITACCECGCCSYVCPAGIPLAQIIRTGKSQLPRE